MAEKTLRGDQARYDAKNIDQPLSSGNMRYRVRPVMRLGQTRTGRKSRRS